MLLQNVNRLLLLTRPVYIDFQNRPTVVTDCVTKLTDWCDKNNRVNRTRASFQLTCSNEAYALN